MRRAWANLLTFLALVGLLAVLSLTAPRWAGLFREQVTVSDEDGEPVPLEPTSGGGVERKIIVQLFFESPERPGLVLEERSIRFSEDLSRQVQILVEELIQGSTADLIAPFPPETRVLDVFVTSPGIAYVDLELPSPPAEEGEEGDAADAEAPSPTPEGAEPSPTPPAPEVILGIEGSSQELLTVYALVNSVVVNLPAVRRVQIVIAGKPVKTLAGHVDLSRPLAADATYLAPEPEQGDMGEAAGDAPPVGEPADPLAPIAPGGA